MRALTLLGAMWLAGCGAAPCAAETTTCGCYARRSQCTVVTDGCFCPSECGAEVACVCGGGTFVRCEENAR